MKENFLNNKIYYRTNEFKPDRQTLVFVHGVSGSSSAWWEYENKFKDKYNLLSYDIRGHGKSFRYETCGDYQIDNFTNDLYELVNYLNIKNFIMVSHSYGTFISLKFFQIHKELVKSLIFLSPNFNAAVMPEAKVSKPFINLLSKINFPISKTKERVHLDYLKSYPNTGDFDIKRTIADVSNTSLRTFVYCMKQAYSFNGEVILKEINIPTLIIHGKIDSIFPVKYGILMASKIKNSKIITLENVSHELKDSMETINKISEAMESFLEEI